MQIDALRYHLRETNVQGTPREIRLGSRDLGRLLVVDRPRKRRLHSHVVQLPALLNAGDVVVLNNSKRINGVLRGRTRVGGLVEFRFVDLANDNEGLCRIFPSHDVAQGHLVRTRAGGLVEVIDLHVTKYDLAHVKGVNATLREQLRTGGQPIPGFFYDGHWTVDHLNPFYATVEGSVESPLAGLHFTQKLVDRLVANGVHVCFVTLHSVGSWLPFLESDISDHEMWPETYHVPVDTATTINRAHEKGSRVLACGSTTLRALEASASPNGDVRPISGRTSLYIMPGYNFRVVDLYFTNFHQSQTSLMVLDAAFAGADLVRASYRDAARRGYSFFEFGDAVLFA